MFEELPRARSRAEQLNAVHRRELARHRAQQRWRRVAGFGAAVSRRAGRLRH